MKLVERVGLAGVLSLGLFLRIHGLGFGMPILSNLYVRPDESLIATSAAEIFTAAGRPGTFAYPALLQEATAVVYHAAYPAARALGLAKGASVPEDFGADPTRYYMILRWISALCGAATVAVVYALARRLGLGSAAALLAAAMYAASPLAVRDAHFGVTDTPYVLLCCLALLFVLRFLEAEPERDGKDFWRAAGLIIAAVATKYAALLMAPVLLTAMLVKRRGRLPWLRVAAAVAGGTAVFFALNPYLLLMWARAQREIGYILRALYLWQPGDPQWQLPAAVWQVVRPLRHGPGGWIGLTLALVSAASLLLAAVRGRRDVRLLLPAQALCCTFAVLLPFQHTVPYRYLLPALPWIALLAAAGLDHGWRRWRPVVFAVAWLCLVAPGMLQSVQMDRLLSAKDTRTLAGEWIQANVPPAVPLVWAGGPECEAQFDESVPSIGRRIEFVHKRYGPFSGAIVSQPYHLMAAAKARTGGAGFEVYRNPETDGCPPRRSSSSSLPNTRWRWRR